MMSTPLHQRSAVQVPKLVDVFRHHNMRCFRICGLRCSILYTPFVQLLITIKFLIKQKISGYERQQFINRFDV